MFTPAQTYQAMTPPAPSRSPSSTSASDADVSIDAEEEESADDSDFLEADLDGLDDTTNLPILSPATPKPSSISHPWPYNPQLQLSPTFSSPPSTVQTLAPIPASSLPHEILLHILRLLPPASLSPALLVCKAWCQCGVELLWHKPSFTNLSSLYRMLVVLSSTEQTFPYPLFIRRLNFSSLHEEMGDKTLRKLLPCIKLERLTLSACSALSSAALVELISNCQGLVALDLSDVIETDDEVVLALARTCPRLQGLNLSGCSKVTDRGLEAIARACPMMKRLKLRRVELLSDIPIIILARNCPLLLELDVVGCPRLTSLATRQIFRSLINLRELSLQSCVEITDDGFPDVSAQRYGSTVAADDLPTFDGSLIPCPSPLRGPKLRSLEHLRYLDLTSMVLLTDNAIAGIVRWMPRVRNLIIAKCTGLTNEGILSICQLGKHLHYLHMGHVSSITDAAVTKLARACTRLRYIDLACCNLLTDMSVFELAANLPRLKRIGLVRVTNLTDDAISALFVRTSLERIHLSYCDRLSVNAINALLSHLTRLTHLSLTGVAAFRRPDLQKYCRPAPKDFNSNQRASFCVYSGKGVAELRRYLRVIFNDNPRAIMEPDEPGAAVAHPHNRLRSSVNHDPRSHQHRTPVGTANLPPIPPHMTQGRRPSAAVTGGVTRQLFPPTPPSNSHFAFSTAATNSAYNIPAFNPRNAAASTSSSILGDQLGGSELRRPMNVNRGEPSGSAWRWDHGRNSGSHVPLYQPGQSSDSSIRSQAPAVDRRRRGTVTRGNFLEDRQQYREDVEMSDDEIEEEGEGSEERDVEMRDQ